MVSEFAKYIPSFSPVNGCFGIIWPVLQLRVTGLPSPDSMHHGSGGDGPGTQSFGFWSISVCVLGLRPLTEVGRASGSGLRGCGWAPCPLLREGAGRVCLLFPQRRPDPNLHK